MFLHSCYYKQICNDKNQASSLGESLSSVSTPVPANTNHTRHTQVHFIRLSSCTLHTFSIQKYQQRGLAQPATSQHLGDFLPVKCNRPQNTRKVLPRWSQRKSQPTRSWAGSWFYCFVLDALAPASFFSSSSSSANLASCCSGVSGCEADTTKWNHDNLNGMTHRKLFVCNRLSRSNYPSARMLYQ